MHKGREDKRKEWDGGLVMWAVLEREGGNWRVRRKREEGRRRDGEAKRH